MAWAKDNWCPWEEATCALLAEHGRLEVLQWALEHDCPWDHWTLMERAAKGGHLEVVKWWREHGGSWGGTCALAAEGGHLEVLKWAREHHCPWDEETCHNAAGWAPGRVEVGAGAPLPVG